VEDVVSIIKRTGVVPILFAHDIADAEVVIRAVEQTEDPVIEILQRGDLALEVLKEAVKFKKKACIGAGTICTLDQCKKMIDSGAEFIVSPGYNPEIVSHCMKNNIPVIPGVSTPTEVMMSCSEGVTLVKFFPFYELGAAAYLNAIAGPFPEIQFVITGGINDRELSFLANPKIAAVGGVWMFCTEQDHTLKPEKEIVSIMNNSLSIAKHYKGH